MKQLRILLVDDSIEFLKAAKNFLDHDPRVLIVGQARDGAEAVRLAADRVPHLVLMDVVMPVLDGLSAGRVIKALRNPPKVILVSTLDAQSFHFVAEEIADGFVPKAKFADCLPSLIDDLFSKLS
jgi:DNA-binding NarL/FixJ family response regulator